MATASQQTSDAGRKNWIQSCVALCYTKEGLEDFVLDEMTEFQKDILAAIAVKNHLPPGATCNSCTTANILPCKTINYCKTGGRCQVHNIRDPARKSDIPCINNICKDLRENIRRNHRFYQPHITEPSWKNADATKFCSDPFQILKCYMSPDGYSNVQTIQETDFNGIINVIINCKIFQNKLASKLFQKTNVFTEAREIGQKIRHSPNLSVSDADLAKQIDTLIQLLSDPKYLVLNNNAKGAVVKLQKLKAKGLPFNEEENKRISDALTSFIKTSAAENIEMTEKMKEQITLQFCTLQEEIQKLLKTTKTNFKSYVKKAVQKIERKSDHALGRIERAGRETETKINAAATQFITIIDVKHTGHSRHSVTISVESPGERPPSFRPFSHVYTEENLMSPTSFDFEYRCLFEDLKNDLLLHYGTMYCSATVSPLIDDHNVELSSLYVEPKLQHIDLSTDHNQLEETSPDTYIKSFRDIFFNGPNPCKNIYITSNAAVGKTILLKRICQLWCKSQSREQCTEQEKEKVDALRHFEFVFMLALDESDADICDIDDMIQKQILPYLSRHVHYSEKFLIEVLHNHKCLIMLDGLDKWIHPCNCSQKCKTDLIPRRKVRPHCTIMTTSSRWKFNTLILKDTQIDRHVNVCELDQNTSSELITKAVSFMNSKTRNKKSEEQIRNKIVSSKIDETLLFNPYIILQLVCLLFDGITIGRTKCELYCSMISLILARCRDKIRYLNCNFRTLERCPPCLQCHDECKRNFGFLLSIGMLAFETLFIDSSSSVFGKAIIDNYISNETLETCLKLGLLIKIKPALRYSSRQFVFTFHNKSLQMFFAALYAQSEHGQRIWKGTKQSVIRRFHGTSDDSDMLDFFLFVNGFNQTFLCQIIKPSISAEKEDGIFKFRKMSSVVRSADEQSKAVKFYQCVATECSNESLECGHGEVAFQLEDIIIDSDTKSDENIEVVRHCVEKNVYHIKSLCIRECASGAEAKRILDGLGVRNIHHLEKLELRSIPPVLILQSLLRQNKDTLRCLDMCSFEFGKTSYIYHNRELTFEREHIKVIYDMKNLQVITLASLILDHGDMDSLFRVLSMKTEMKQIVLYYIECREQRKHNCNGHPLDLSLHTNLQVFGLDRVPVTTLKMNALNLEECWIGKLSSHILSQMFADLQKSKKLQTLYCLRHDDICAMLRSLPKLYQIAYIHFREINLGNRVISLNSKNVRLVTLTGVTMSSTALRLLFDSIEDLQHEFDICLENVTVGDAKDFSEIKEIIRKSPKFTIYDDSLNVRKQRVFKFRKNITSAENTDRKTFISSSERM